MTITVKYTDGANATELEIIRACAGLEVRRERIKSDTHGGQSFSTGLDGSETLILREVAVDADIEQLPGEQRHGTLDVPDASDPALEEGDVDTELHRLSEVEAETAQRVLDLVEMLLGLDGEPMQQQAYGELREVFREYKTACAQIDNHVGAAA